MAEKLTSESANKEHNVKEINHTIKDADTRISRLEEERKALNADIQEIRMEVKGQGILLKDFDVARRYYRLEGDDRYEALDNLKLCFEALGMGDQSDMFPANENAGAKAA